MVCSVYFFLKTAYPVFSTSCFPLIALGEKVFYVGVQFVICVYVNVLKEQEKDFI